MKNKYYKNKKILLCGSLALGLLLTGCSSSVAKLAITSDEVVTLDASAKVNPSDYLEDVVEGAEVSYTISDNVMTITVSKDDKTETFEVPVEIEEPNVSIDENITIDTYVGYDIEDYIHEDEGVSHTTNFDEETGDLSVTFTKGEWTTTLDSKVEVTSSEPEEVWPKTYSCYEALNGVSETIVLNENGRFIGNGLYPGTIGFDENGVYSSQHDGYAYLSAYGTLEQFTVDLGLSFSGDRVLQVCTLVK